MRARCLWGRIRRVVTAADLGNVPLARFEEVFARYRAVYPEMSEEQLRSTGADGGGVLGAERARGRCAGEGRRDGVDVRLDFAPGSGRLKGEAYHSEELGLVWDKPNEQDCECSGGRGAGEADARGVGGVCQRRNAGRGGAAGVAGVFEWDAGDDGV